MSDGAKRGLQVDAERCLVDGSPLPEWVDHCERRADAYYHAHRSKPEPAGGSPEGHSDE